MRIGLSYDLKEAVSPGFASPEDALEEYDTVETVQAISAAFEAHGHTVVWLGGGREFLTNILREQVDIVFNIAEGRGNMRSREAQVPSVLEMLDIPYSGSDPQCLAICLDKHLTKKLVALAGVSTPRWLLIANLRQLHEMSWDGFPLPALVKPSHEGSSKGIRAGSKVEDVRQAAEAVAHLLDHYHQPVMVEEFIAGDEVTVGMVGNSPPKVLGIMRVLPKHGGLDFTYSLEVKREWECLVEYECPAQLNGTILKTLEHSSLQTFNVLGCRDFARLDFRVSPEGVAYFLEVNPLPGLNPKTSDLPIMARKMGLDYAELIAKIFDAALERYPLCVRG